MGNQLLTVRQAAEMLGVSRMTIYRRIEEGVLHPVYDFKNVAHVRWDEINEILQNLRKNGWN